MTDDLLTRMRSASSLGAAIKCLDEGADEIESLRRLLAEGRDLMQAHADEIELLRALLHGDALLLHAMCCGGGLVASEYEVLNARVATLNAALGDRHE